MDACEAYKQIYAVMSALNTMRPNAAAVHCQWYTSAVAMADELNVLASVPTKCSRQIKQENTPSETSEEYNWRAVTIPMMDYLVGQMKIRLSTVQLAGVKSFNLIPTVYF